MNLKAMFDHLDPLKVVQRVQNFQKEGIWEQHSGGKLGQRLKLCLHSNIYIWIVYGEGAAVFPAIPWHPSMQGITVP